MFANVWDINAQLTYHTRTVNRASIIVYSDWVIYGVTFLRYFDSIPLILDNDASCPM